MIDEKMVEEVAESSGVAQYMNPLNKCLVKFAEELSEKLQKETSRITVDMIEAKKVLFLKPIFEEDFAERGMKAWLTGIEWDQKSECYELFFDFSDFEKENEKYFRLCYHPNRHTKEIEADTGRRKFTACESGNYFPKVSNYVWFGDVRNDAEFPEKIAEYLMVVE